MKLARVMESLASILILVDASGALAEQSYSLPTPSNGCHMFTQAGREIRVSEATDLQRYQVADCEKTVQSISASNEYFASEQKRRADAIAADQAHWAVSVPKGGGAQTPYPLPANTPTIIIQSQ